MSFETSIKPSAEIHFEYLKEYPQSLAKTRTLVFTDTLREMLPKAQRIHKDYYDRVKYDFFFIIQHY